MKSKISLILLSLTISSMVEAITVQHIILKNGTELNGYIQQQDKSDNITFRSDNAVICVSGKGVTTTERVYKLSELDKNWIEWAEKNEAFNGSGDARTLTLNEIVFTQNYGYNNKDSVVTSAGRGFEQSFAKQRATVTKVKVLEKGINIKYLELTPNTYTFNWNDVETIKADMRPKTALSGIDRVYLLKSGQEVRGEYAGESYNTLSLYTGNGVVETFNIDDVMKYFYKPINPNQNIFEQSELTDIVRTKDNGTFQGVIVERNFVEGNNYLVIQQQTGSSQMLKFADVQGYSKEENPEYSPKFDILLKEGEVVINRVPTDSVGVHKEGTTLILDSINHNVVVPKEGTTTKIFVEYYNPQHRTSEHLLLVKVDKSVVKKKDVYCFSSDLFEMKTFLPNSIETSVNHTTKIEYTVTGQGVFALYDQQKRQAMPFIVK